MRDNLSMDVTPFLLNYLLHIGLMLIISKVFTILCLLCLCENMEYTGGFQNKAASIKFFFQAQVKWEGRHIWSGPKHSRIIL